MVRVAVLGLVLSSQSGCIAVGAGIYGGSRTETLDAVGRIMASRHPDLPPDQAADCVVRAMKPIEVVKFGTSYRGTLTTNHVATVQEVENRDAVAACLKALQKTPVTQ